MATSRRYSVSAVVVVFVLAALYAGAAATRRTRAPLTLSYARAGHTATALPDGRVLVVGGSDEGRNVAAAERLTSDYARGWMGLSKM